MKTLLCKTHIRHLMPVVVASAALCVNAVMQENLVPDKNPSSSSALCAPLPTMPDNTGFEDGKKGWRVPSTLWRIEEGAGRNGSKCLVWENSDPEGYHFPQQKLAVDAGGIYRYGAWVKVDSLVDGDKRWPGPKVSLQFADAKGNCVNEAEYAKPVGKPDPDGWVRYEGTTRPLSSGTVRGSLLCYLSRGSTGCVRFDDFSFVCEGARHVDVVVSSAYRDTAEEGRVSFVATIFVNPATMPPESLLATFSYRNVDGTETEVPADTLDAEHAAVKLDVGRFAAGTHPVTFVLRTKTDGRELGRATCSFTRGTVARRVAFDRFGRTLVDGKLFFPLGMYAYDLTPEVLALYTNGTPYNCIMPYHAPAREMLNACKAAKLKVIYSVKDLVYGVRRVHERFASREASFSHIAKLVRSVKGHPAVLAWYANDESPRCQVETLRDLREMIHGLDPDHPVWHVLNKTPRIMPFLGAYDVVGQDPYPIGSKNGDIGRAASQARATRQSMYDTVPMWHVPQAFNWAWYKSKPSESHRYPSAEELVSMTWQPIAAGANGLIYYGFHSIIGHVAEGQERDEYLRRVVVAASEVKAKMPVLLSEPGPSILSEPEGMVCRTWRSAPGITTLLAVNTTREAVAGIVTLADGLPPQTVELPPIRHTFIEIKAEKTAGITTNPDKKVACE